MNSKEIIGLAEAYMEVYSPERLDEEERPLPVDKMRGQMFAHKVRSNDTKNVSRSMRYHTRANRIDDTLSGKRKPQVSRGKYAEKEKDGNRFPNRLTRSDKQGIRDSYEYDLYDIILEHLLDEGYVETLEAAESIMVNMSEDWRESICEGRVAWDDKKNPNPSGYTPKEKSEAKRRQLGVDDPNTSSFEKGGPGENEYARHGNLAATQEKMKKRSNQPKGKPHQFRKNPFWTMDPGQVKRKILGTEVPKNKRSSYEGKNMPSIVRHAESYDYYDIILSHLLDEGYVETLEAAESIMVNMSEDWRESILDEAFKEIDRAKHGRMYDRYKKLRTAAMKDAEETGEASGPNRSKMGKMSSAIDKSAENLRNKG